MLFSQMLDINFYIFGHNILMMQAYLGQTSTFAPVYVQRLVDGADEYLQLLDVASSVMRAMCNMPEDFSQECQVVSGKFVDRDADPYAARSCRNKVS